MPVIKNSDVLLQSEFQVKLPFSIKTNTENFDKITCFEALRILPKRRLVCKAKWQDKTVIVKLFYHSQKRNRDYQREIAGHHALKNFGIKTPPVFWSGSDLSDSIAIVIYEFLNGETLLSYLSSQKKTNTKKKHRFTETIKKIAEMHNQGIMQPDIHPDNFFIAENSIYVIDSGAIESNIKNQSYLFKNFLLFLAQFPPEYDKNAQNFLRTYQISREIPQKPVRMRKKIQKSRIWRLKKYQKKMTRNCSAFKCKKTSRELFISQRDNFDHLSNLLPNLDSLIKQGEMLKKGNQSTVSKVTFDKKTLIIKRYNIKNKLHGIGRAIRPSRAWHAWKNGLTLEFYHIKTPKPLAIYEKRFGPFRSTAYLMMESIDGMDIVQFSKEHIENQQQLATMATEIATLLKKFQYTKIAHGDLKGSNIIIKNNQPYLIDLDAMKNYRTPLFFHKAHQKDMKRFLKNWLDNDKLFTFYHSALKTS